MWQEIYSSFRDYLVGINFLTNFGVLLFVFSLVKDKGGNIINNIESLNNDISEKREGKLKLYINKIILTKENGDDLEESRERKDILIKFDKFYSYQQVIRQYYKKHKNGETKVFCIFCGILTSCAIGIVPEKYFYHSKDISFIMGMGILMYLLSYWWSLLKSNNEVEKIKNSEL
jgi:hypothetical protein